MTGNHKDFQIKKHKYTNNINAKLNQEMFAKHVWRKCKRFTNVQGIMKLIVKYQDKSVASGILMFLV